MLYYLSAIGLIAHTYFWGLGFAWLSLPRIWRRWWWVFAPGLGFALQSALVWVGGAHTNLAGTDSYAWWSELIPLALLIGAIVRRGGPVAPGVVWLAAGDHCLRRNVHFAHDEAGAGPDFEFTRQLRPSGLCGGSARLQGVCP